MSAARVTKQLTLLLLHSEGRVLLGLKKRGFGSGKYNGFGGKIDPHETIRHAAIRETVEEAGVTPLDAQLRGHIVFEFVDHPEVLEVHVFHATKYAGEPTEGDEMRPEWFPDSAIPLERMWLDDKYWLPLLLKGKAFVGRFLFRGHEEIASHDLREVSVESLPYTDDAQLVTELQSAITAT